MSSTASKLAELPGLEGAKRAALRLTRSDSGAHALLLYGAEGAGKTKLAESIAQAWLCTSPTSDGACGECQACAAFERDRSPDLLHIFPRGSSSIIHARAVTSKAPEPKEYENVTPLLDFVRTPPLSSRFKVVVVRSADRMNSAAANAFLKTLEEPHPHARIVMTTSTVGHILPTILSRCVCVACELPQGPLMEGGDSDLVVMAEGAPGRFKHLKSHEAPYLRIAELARRLGDASPSHALVLAEEFRSACADLEASTSIGARAANVEGLRAIGSFVAKLSPRDEWMQAIAEAHRRTLGNASAASVTDALFARMLAPTSR